MSCSPYFSINSTTEQMEENLLSMSELFDYQNDSAKRYDAEFLDNSIKSLTNIIAIVKSAPNLYNYPMIVDRLDAGPISQTEYADFLIATGTTQESVEYVNSTYESYYNSEDYLSVTTMQYLSNMNAYYTDNFSSSITGGICSLIPKFEAILDQFNETLAIMLGILSIQTVINELIDTIKQQLLSILDQLINEITSCLGSINGIANTVKDTKNFFSDLSIENLKTTVSTFIADIASKFEVPEQQTDIEDTVKQTEKSIQYLLYRLCQFATAVEDFMMAPIRALQTAVDNCSKVGSVLTNASDRFTLTALEAGAFRISEDYVNSIKLQLAYELNNSPENNPNSGSVDVSGSALPSNYWTRPFDAEEKSMYIELVSATPDQLNSESTLAQHWLKFHIGQCKDIPYEKAEIKELQASIVIIAIRIAKRLGRPLKVISAYRHPDCNRKIKGAATNSYHISGLALDIDRSSFGLDYASGENFIKLASQEGCGGIGTYSDFIHIDTGPRRKWTDTSGPLAHLNALLIHQKDNFRNGL